MRSLFPPSFKNSVSFSLSFSPEELARAVDSISHEVSMLCVLVLTSPSLYWNCIHSTHPESTLAFVSHCCITSLSDALPPSYPCSVLFAPTLGIPLKGFGFIILCEHTLSSTRCRRSCLHQSSRMREGGEELLAAEYQPQPSREPCRSAAVPPWFAFSSHIPSHLFILASFPQCV